MQIAPSADTDRRAVRKLQRAMERSRCRRTFTNHKTVEVVRHGKKHASLKVKSEGFSGVSRSALEICGQNPAEFFVFSAATRKRESTARSATARPCAGHIIVEDNSYAAFQRGRFSKTLIG